MEKYSEALDQAIYEMKWALRYGYLSITLSFVAFGVSIFTQNFELVFALIVFAWVSILMGNRYSKRARKIEEAGRPK